jgi:AraC-like DNA-binding protein
VDAPNFISKQVVSGDYFFLETSRDPASSITIVCGGREICGPSYSIQRDDFPFWSMEYVIAGEGNVTIHGDSFPISPGTLFRYGPGIPHAISVEPDSTLDKLFVDFAGTAVPSWWTGSWETPRPIHVPGTSGIQALFLELIRQGQRGVSITPRLCALLVEQIALLAAEDGVDQSAVESPSWLTYVRCKTEIESHFKTLRTLGEIADRCHVGEAWLCRLFAQYDTETPYKLLVRRKMGLASSLLANKHRLVKDVAAELGYDPYHFSKVFKKATGYAPEDFRNVVGQRNVVRT